MGRLLLCDNFHFAILYPIWANIAESFFENILKTNGTNLRVYYMISVTKSFNYDKTFVPECFYSYLLSVYSYKIRKKNYLLSTISKNDILNVHVIEAAQIF